MAYSQAATALPQPATAYSQPSTTYSQPTTKTYNIVEGWDCHRVTLMFPLLYQADLSYYSVTPQMKIRIGIVSMGINAA
jgi:hypothetical protein